MSLAEIHPADFHSSHGSLLSLSHSLDDLVGLGAVDWHLHHPSGDSQRRHQQDHVLTIEQLRLEMTTCFTCGVSWMDDHVSLDCSECGGYARERPCLDCDGKCGGMWKRDLSLSHSSGKARWQGECLLIKDQNQPLRTGKPSDITTYEAESDITKRLEKLSANS